MIAAWPDGTQVHFDLDAVLRDMAGWATGDRDAIAALDQFSFFARIRELAADRDPGRAVERLRLIALIAAAGASVLDEARSRE